MMSTRVEFKDECGVTIYSDNVDYGWLDVALDWARNETFALLSKMSDEQFANFGTLTITVKTFKHHAKEL